MADHQDGDSRDRILLAASPFSDLFPRARAMFDSAEVTSPSSNSAFIQPGIFVEPSCIQMPQSVSGTTFGSLSIRMKEEEMQQQPQMHSSDSEHADFTTDISLDGSIAETLREAAAQATAELHQDGVEIPNLMSPCPSTSAASDSIVFSVAEPKHSSLAVSSMQSLPVGGITVPEAVSIVAIQTYQCVVCNFQTTNRQQFAKHNRTHSGAKLHKCSECSAGFTRMYYLKKHAVLKHNSISPPLCCCPFDGCEFSTRSTMLMTIHKRGHRREKLGAFACRACKGVSYLSERAAFNHCTKFHPGESFTKYIRRCTPEHPDGLGLEVQMSSPPRSDDELRAQQNRAQHVPCASPTGSASSRRSNSVERQLPKYVCDKCGFIGGTFRVLYAHRRKCVESFSSACTHCSRKFTTADKLASHLKSVHSKAKPRKAGEKKPRPPNYFCDHCSFATSNRRVFEAHFRRLHTMLVTPQAQPSSTGDSQLTSHSVNAQFSCNRCSFVTNIQSSLEIHRVSVHGQVTAPSSAASPRVISVGPTNVSKSPSALFHVPISVQSQPVSSQAQRKTTPTATAHIILQPRVQQPNRIYVQPRQSGYQQQQPIYIMATGHGHQPAPPPAAVVEQPTEGDSELYNVIDRIQESNHGLLQLLRRRESQLGDLSGAVRQVLQFFPALPQCSTNGDSVENLVQRLRSLVDQFTHGAQLQYNTG